MAMVDALPVPDSRQKVDELFLYWLSDPSRQDMLRSELAKVCRCGSDMADGGDAFLAQAVAGIQQSRPLSPGPGFRTPSPPLHLANSPKSPRTKRRAKSMSPRKAVGKSGLLAEPAAVGRSPESTSHGEEIDSPAFSSPSLREPEREREVAENGGSASAAARTKVEEVAVVVNKNSSLQEKLSQSPSRPAAEAIPPFFFPYGQPKAGENLEQQLRDAAQVFQLQPSGEIARPDFHLVVKVVALSLSFSLSLSPLSLSLSLHTP